MLSQLTFITGKGSTRFGSVFFPMQKTETFLFLIIQPINGITVEENKSLKKAPETKLFVKSQVQRAQTAQY